TANNYLLSGTANSMGSNVLAFASANSLHGSMTSSFCTSDDLAKALNVDVSEINSVLEALEEENYSDRYEYYCVDEETEEIGCYDYDNDEDVDLQICDDNNAYP